MKELETKLRAVGYEAGNRELLALASIVRRRGKGAAALLLEGPPGCGKTFLGEAFAVSQGWPLVYGQLHAWSDADELFVGVNVAAAVAGEADAVRQEGLLTQAARLSQAGPVVLLLDEIDKTSERCEALLLDFLQSGRVPLSPGVHIQADQNSLYVFITSNAQRELSDALLRRVRKVRMDPLNPKTFDALVVRDSGAPSGICTMVSKACRVSGGAEGSPLSVQEAIQASRECWELASSCDDVLEILSAWSRGPAGIEAVRKSQIHARIWGETLKYRRGLTASTESVS